MEPELTEIVNRTSKIHIGAHGIVWVVINPGAEQTLADAKANVSDTARLINNQRSLILVDMSHVKSMDRDAREYYSGPDTARISRAIAIIVISPVSRFVGNFVITTFRSKQASTPCKLFGNQADAISWLLSIDPVTS